MSGKPLDQARAEATTPHETPHDASPVAVGADDHARREDVWTQLLAWYVDAGRATLPWRHTRDPYAVLVAEIMLQQTQVERVLPKYAEFLARFPSFEALAAAGAAAAIQGWRGLGYNTRAVRLWRIARQVVEEHGGQLPDTLDGLMRLSGIGRYTAGAIACFAFGLPVATVDTNIRRVMWRVFRGIEPAEWPAGVAAQRDVLGLAGWALPSERAYDWQQALMDLGATVCTSRRPACERCPLAACCAAYAESARVALFPSGKVLAHVREERGEGVQSAPRTVESAEVEDGTREGRKASAKIAKKERKRSADQAADQAAARALAGGKMVAQERAPYRAGSSRKAQEPFDQSSRYFRGRAVDALRALAPGETLPLAELGARIRPGFTADNEPWLRGLVARLARDGLVRVIEADDGVTVGLP